MPLSRIMIAATFIIMFGGTWNQYLWPSLMAPEEGFFTLVRSIKQIMQVWIGASIPDFNEALALAIPSMVLAFSCMFIKGLMESEK
ncbi:MAG: sn-glycerol 3-phosphate transport system permease protein [Paracoccaceae bacterium]|jgi:sn-glycerol 3-phosphate transport system permease protein